MSRSVDDPEVEPAIAAHTVEVMAETAPAPAKEAAQRVEPEIPEVETRNKATAKQGSVPNTAKPMPKHTPQPEASQRTRPPETTGNPSRSKKPGTGEARVFTPPPAPDDPGTDAVEAEDVTVPLRPQRA